MKSYDLNLGDWVLLEIMAEDPSGTLVTEGVGDNTTYYNYLGRVVGFKMSDYYIVLELYNPISYKRIDNSTHTLPVSYIKQKAVLSDMFKVLYV